MFSASITILSIDFGATALASVPQRRLSCALMQQHLIEAGAGAVVSGR